MDYGIAILSFNHPVLTARCLESVLNHADAAAVTLIHNGSRADVANDLRDCFPKVRHLVFRDNRGFSGGVNRAFRDAFQFYDWVFLVTNDCELTKVGPL